MVDIKREDITLSDWTKGISADEFAWGSYFYSEAISSGYDTKGFELWPRFTKTELNTRSYWYPVALAPTVDYWAIAFTRDWMMETEEKYNWSSTGDGDSSWGGALFSRCGTTSYDDYVNWISYWDRAIWITERYIDVVDTRAPFSPRDELLTEPLFDNGWAAWTLGTWWTLTDNWVEHTTWTTGTLSATINFDSPPSSSDYIRVAIKVANGTTWHLEVSLNNPTTDYDAPNTRWSGWVTLSLKCSSSTTTLIITPTSSFNGTIEAVNVHLYDSSKVFLQRGNLYSWQSWQPHPALVWEWDLYIACGHYVNIFSLSDWGRTYKALVDENFTIVSMTQQAGSLILWATDWFNSRQYYWDGVDAVATEVIEWKWLVIQWVTGTETISYVLTTSWSSNSSNGYEYRLYAVSGYQRSLIASKLYQYMSSYYLQEEPYNINKKFDFNDVTGDQCMTMYLDSLYIPWCDGVYKYGYDVPGLRSNWTRPIKYDTGATKITLVQRNNFLNIWYRLDSINYIWSVNNRLYTSKWYLITESIYWDKLSSRKALEKIKIWYKNVASTVGNIKLYVIVDDDYFWRFRPTSTPTTRPAIWDVYSVADDTTAKVIDVDTTNNVITLVTVNNGGSRAGLANTTLTKVSWAWDDTISVGYRFDNMCFVKKIESEQQEYGSDLIFGKKFVDSYLPYRHKIQFVIELNSNSRYLSPEIYEISIASDITDVVL